MKFTWIGGPSFVLELGPFRIVGDPVLADTLRLEGIGEVRRLTARPDVDLSRADLLLLTSPRADHCDRDAIAGCAAGFLAVPTGTFDLPGATPLAWGESHRMERGQRTLAVHAVPGGAPGLPDTERGNGYFLRLEGGDRPFTAYVTGDTLFSEDTRVVQRTHGYANLLIVHLGAETGTAGALRSADAKDAMQIVYRMQPNAIAAVHHTSFSLYREPLNAFVQKAGLTIYDKRLRVLREGESFEKSIGSSTASDS
jgi:L-ascorbate metabolism protein UlaG (beta-lactamase superfamily)